MFFEKSLRLKYIILILQSKIIRFPNFSPKALLLKQKIRLVFTGRTFFYLNKDSSDEEMTGREAVRRRLLPSYAYFFRKAANGEISRRS